MRGVSSNVNIMNTANPYIAFSYNFSADYEFVVRLGTELERRGVSTWFLGELQHPTDVTNQQRLSGDYDWEAELDNWHATFVEHLIGATGIIVVLSDGARASHATLGRGMWRERAAVDFLRSDNALRVRDVENPTRRPGNAIPEGLIHELVSWGQQVLNLSPVSRPSISDPNSFNLPSGDMGRTQLPNRKSVVTEWYELVRRDIYDVQWHCRRCSLKSAPYIMRDENPPEKCPRCGFTGGVADDKQS